MRLDPGTLLAKLDLQGAHRIVPAHPDDRPLLGMRWGDDVFLDTVLPLALAQRLRYTQLLRTHCFGAMADILSRYVGGVVIAPKKMAVVLAAFSWIMTGVIATFCLSLITLVACAIYACSCREAHVVHLL